MDKEFVFLAVFCCATFVIVFVGLFVQGPIVTAEVIESGGHWDICEEEDAFWYEGRHARDCELRQALVDANLMGDVNLSG